MIPVLYVLGLVSTILLQTTLLNQAEIGGVKPDIALITVYLVGLFGGEVRGVMVGLALGYLTDLMSAGSWGVHLATKATLGLLAGRLGRTLLNVQAAVTGFIIALCSLFQGTVFLIVSLFTSDPENLSGVLGYIVLPQAVYDGILGGVIFWFISAKFQPRPSTAQVWFNHPALSSLGDGFFSKHGKSLDSQGGAPEPEAAPPKDSAGLSMGQAKTGSPPRSDAGGGPQARTRQKDSHAAQHPGGARQPS